MDTLNISHWTESWLDEIGLNEGLIPYVTFLVDLSILLLIALIFYIIFKRIILSMVRRYVNRSANTYDDVFLEKKVFHSLANLIPAILLYYLLPIVMGDFTLPLNILQELLVLFVIFTIANVARKFLKALEHIALNAERFEGKPVSSYIQVGMIIVYITAGIFTLSSLLSKDATTILTTFGAATAVILLIFRDTLLGLVASIQIAGNDMVRLGDWVSMEKFGADGVVTEINLTTVKVRNWDKTITTVPTYSFIADSFKNWRGMESQGARRIMRSMRIDLNTIRYVDQAMVEKFSRYERVRDYLATRQEEILQYNEAHKIDKSELINGRHMTNIGLFRQYALEYLRQHPKVASNEHIMVRQLEPTERGLPLQIYCFSTEITWIKYENIQSDIMDHLLAAVDKFDLRMFQDPSGLDIKSLKNEQKS